MLIRNNNDNLHIKGENNLKLSSFGFYCKENQYICNSIS